VATKVVRIGDEHAAQPRVVSISQSTEMGTLYTRDEVRAIADHAHAHGLLLHMDGARITNAAAALGCSLREASTDLGVDVLSFGGTKAGLLAGEAVVVLSDEAAAAMPYLRKQTLQLASKMRFLSAQLEALLTDELWRRATGNANAMAARLADAVRGIPGVEVTQEPQANAVFAILPPERIAPLQEKWFFHVWDDRRHEVRWMTAWDTTEEDVDGFVAELRVES
jgi:threonine aldolase